MKMTLAVLGLAFLSLGLATTASAQSEFEDFLEKTRKKYDLPALAGAMIFDGKVEQATVVGVRKYGDSTPATLADKFHIGSDTKSMTAVLIGQLVDEGKLKWDTTLGDVFPAQKEAMLPEYRTVTIKQLLAQVSGVPGESYPGGLNWWAEKGTLPEQRLKYVGIALKQTPASKPGTEFLYSNANYIIAGAVVEKITGKAWEDVVAERLFKPLGLTSAGFGAPGTVGKVDQPYPHGIKDGKPVPTPLDGVSDNAPVLGPAGRVNCSVEDFAKYAAFHLTDGGAILKSETMKALHTVPGKGEYALGWLAVERPWAGGTALTHSGSNTMNYAVIWLAPKRDFGVVAMTNVGGDNGAKACDEVSAYVLMKLAKRYAEKK